MNNLYARGGGELNPCFDDIRLRVSADVLLEGFASKLEGVDCPGWRRMLSLLLSQRSSMASVWKRSNSQYRFPMDDSEEVGSQSTNLEAERVEQGTNR